MSERYEDADGNAVEALEKIKAVLREHDLWAAVTVVSQERVHFLYHFEPSWSCLSFDRQTGEARFRAKRADFASKEQHRYVVERTSGAIGATRDMAAQQFKEMSQMHDLLEKSLGPIQHSYSDPRWVLSPRPEWPTKGD